MSAEIDDFVGREFPTKKGGILKVVGKAPKDGRAQYYYCECSICSKDKEMFPDYFLTKKDRLVSGLSVCACGNAALDDRQFEIKVRRLLAEKDITLKQITIKKPQSASKFVLECNKDGYIWEVNYPSIRRSGCPRCSGKVILSKEQVIEEIKGKCLPHHKFIDFVDDQYISKAKSKMKFMCEYHGEFITNFFNYSKSETGHCCQGCINESVGNKNRKKLEDIQNAINNRCSESKYKFVRFVDEYKNKDSKLIFECPEHGQHVMSFHNFTFHKQGCKKCSDLRREEANPVYGIYAGREEQEDILYVINFDNKYIKVGRTFDIKKRLRQLKTQSGIQELSVIRLFKNKHSDIYKLEQSIHEELRMKGHWSNVGWTIECFNMDSLDLINSILDKEENDTNQ